MQRIKLYLILLSASQRLAWTRTPADGTVIRQGWFDLPGDANEPVVLKPFDWRSNTQKWPVGTDRSALSPERHREFVTDFYDAAESLFPRPVFKANYEPYSKFDGSEFKIVSRNYEEVADEPLAVPTWKIELTDGIRLDAEYDEIFFADSYAGSDLAYDEIAKALLENFDEITEHEEPYVSLDLSRYGLPTAGIPQITGNEFIDELWADLEEAKEGFGLEIAWSAPYDNPDDGCYRVDSVNLTDVPYDLFMLVWWLARHHQGNHCDCRK